MKSYLEPQEIDKLEEAARYLRDRLLIVNLKDIANWSNESTFFIDNRYICQGEAPHENID